MKTYRVTFTNGETEEVQAQAVTSEGNNIVFWDGGAFLVISGFMFEKIVLVTES
jgi:hypothetical protein